jgi:hypothetical protein
MKEVIPLSRMFVEKVVVLWLLCVFLAFFRKPSFDHSVHEIPQPVPILSQMKTLHSISSHGERILQY